MRLILKYVPKCPLVGARVVWRPVNSFALRASWRASVWCNLLPRGIFERIVCSEMSFGGGSRRVETRRLVCVVGRLTGFCMIRVFTEFFPSRLFNSSY